MSGPASQTVTVTDDTIFYGWDSMDGLIILIGTFLWWPDDPGGWDTTVLVAIAVCLVISFARQRREHRDG